MLFRKWLKCQKMADLRDLCELTRNLEEVEDIAACGAGTVSKRVFPDGRIERCDTVKDLDQYIGRIDEMIERKRRLFGAENDLE